jgi:hypothetical protein
VDSAISCSYSTFADHTIDVQCFGAYEKVPGKKLVSEGLTNFIEEDLLFLDRTKEEEEEYQDQLKREE